MILAATGHRPNKLGNEYCMNGSYSKYIKDSMRKIIDDVKPNKLISGLALGVDTIWALLALELEMPLIAAIPFVGQEKRWPKHSQDLYNFILLNPMVEKTIVSDGGYESWKMQRRNEWMVDHCDGLVAVWDDSSHSGTGNCVRYAKKMNKVIYKINIK